MKTFFHKSDLDGHCSGAIIYQKYQETELIGVGYEDTLDRDSIIPGETVYVVDFCFPLEDMIWLNENTNLIWCDHHKTSIEKMQAYPVNIKGLRAINLAGCELTWREIYPGTQVPWSVWALGCYDVWDHADPEILPFQYGVRENENTWPDSDIWPLYFKDLTVDSYKDHIITKSLMNGKLILEYERKQNAKYAASMSYEADFHGYRALVMNKPFSSSKVFDSVYDPAKHDIMILFGVKSPDEDIKYSIYCDKPDIDVSEIAKKYGGGGHRGAAGFTSNHRLL